MLDNDTYEITSDLQRELINRYIPSGDSYDNNERSCRIKQYNNATDSSNVELVKCDSWVYSKKYYGKNLITTVNIILF